MDRGLMTRLAVIFAVLAAYNWVATEHLQPSAREIAAANAQFSDPAHAREAMARGRNLRERGYLAGMAFIVVAGALSVLHHVRKAQTILAVLLLLSAGGCRRPFEPVQLEVITTTEEAFLLPFTEGVDAQSSSHTEEFLKKNLVYTQQVKVPQQWVPVGYETLFPNGSWKPAALLVRVDKSPVTREWTADANTGTSATNQAIWVMTADQVEFSTGWTCTARIASRDDAVKFLHNYPNGSLQTVMDTEVRAKLQAEFALEVTDLPMETLRKQATPHIKAVTGNVIEFFAERGVTITNLGITGGFVYKDPSIIKTLVEVFNAEQKKAIAIAESAAQAEKNKTIQLEAEAKALALKTEKEAEAEGIKSVADAKAYEIDKAAQQSEAYIRLKTLEIERTKAEKWDGTLPRYYFGGGGAGMLFQLPAGAQGDTEEGTATDAK